MSELESLVQEINRTVLAVMEKDEEKETVDDHSAYTALHMVQNLTYRKSEDVLAGCVCFNLLNTYVKQKEAEFGYFFKHYIVRLTDYMQEQTDPCLRYGCYEDNGQKLLIVEFCGLHQFSFHGIETNEAMMEKAVDGLVWNGIRNQKAAMSIYAFLPRVMALGSDPGLLAEAEALASERERLKISEGYFRYLEHKTYYRIAGTGNTARPALVLLHGGPGSTHNYFEVLDRLADTDRQIIMYDQIGCGRSWLENRRDLWTMETWTEELRVLLEHLNIKEYHLLGQSWGGMLALQWLLAEKPEDVRSVILSSTLPSAALWSAELHRMIKDLPAEEQEAIRAAEESGNYTDPAYLAANEHFMALHSFSMPENAPECIRRKKRFGTEAYETAWGPNEYTPSGTLKDFDVTDRLGEINVPALVISGTEDLCTPLIAQTLRDGIPGARWELFEGCRHMAFVEETDRYCRLLDEWMKEHDQAD